MNLGNIVKLLVEGFKFLAQNSAAIKGYVTEAEALFPDAGSGLSKLAHVLGAIFNLIAQVGSGLASLPPEIVGPFLVGHIGSVVKVLFPQVK